ncbi:MAG TPA: ORC1-type DNA replication protein [Methanothrix sp.]|nr:ORC1-type DNA replication protein [Methanothrix sp.]
MLLWDETIFKDREVLEFDHMPEHFAHREPQMEALKFCARPALQGGRPVNALCLGPPGTGKTTAIFKLFSEMEAESSKAVPVHVNCQMDHTRHAIFLRIYSKLLGHSPPASGVSFKRVLEKIARTMAKENRVIVVALDDVNYLFPEKEVDRVLYTLLRGHEAFPGFRAGVIAILSEPALNYVFDPRVSSVFQAEEVSFPLYSLKEIRDILARRATLGFYPGVVSEEIIARVSDLTERAGDLRVGIDLLKRAGMEAERRASRTISDEDVDRSEPCLLRPRPRPKSAGPPHISEPRRNSSGPAGRQRSFDAGPGCRGSRRRGRRLRSTSWPRKKNCWKKLTSS